MSDDLDQQERERVAPYVTDAAGPVFALTGLPEVVKGALFARYSRSPKSLRRLLLDEFLPDAPAAAGAAPAVGEARAEALYGRVLAEYGDDSVAQLGGAHIAVEGASNILTKVLQWGRLASYLEQSNALHRVHRPPRRGLPLPPPGHDPGPPRARPRLHGDPGRGLRRLRGAAAPDGRARGRRRPARPRHARGGPGARDPGARARPAAGPAARRHDRQRRDLRLGAGLRGDAGADGRPPPARSARVRRPDAGRAAQGHPGLPHPRRPRRPRRRSRALPAGIRAGGGRDRGARPAGARPGAGRRAGAARRLRPRRGGPRPRPRHLARGSGRPGRGAGRGRPSSTSRRGRAPSPPGPATAATGASGPGGRSRPRPTRSRSSATTAPTAICSATAC